ncbi:MAG TPA: hypothetical protein VFS76_15240 [Pyrinomonadaceae bacterium]|nr:hypothetical protein [Pyrinomonadaceae bacterium]
MKNKIRVSILDDSLPKREDAVEQDLFRTGIDQEELLVLAEKGSWIGELPLQQLLFSLLKHEYVRTGLLEVVGYTNPEQILSDIDAHPPNVVIYDWEYGTHSPSESENWLLELLEATAQFDAFIFVYSKVPSKAPEVIPAILNSKKFDEFAPRFQLFEKGNSNSIFTAEDFIYQYILTRVSKSNIIKVHGIDVTFKENGYLENPKGIFFLEAILGRAALLEKLRLIKEISNESVEKMMEGIGGHMLINRETGYLIAADFPLAGQSPPKEEISYLKALRDFGLEAITEAVETGFAKI